MEYVRKCMALRNHLGMHARAAARFVRSALEFECDINILLPGGHYNAKSVLEVLIACLSPGTRFVVEARGPNAEQAVLRLESVLKDVEREDSAMTLQAA